MKKLLLLLVAVAIPCGAAQAKNFNWSYNHLKELNRRTVCLTDVGWCQSFLALGGNHCKCQYYDAIGNQVPGGMIRSGENHLRE